jgi:hypothetical protein
MDTGYRTGIGYIRIRTGVFSNLFIFNGAEPGYYINPVLGLNIRSSLPARQSENAEPDSGDAAPGDPSASGENVSPLPAKEWPRRHRAPAPLDMFIGVTGGPAWVLYRSGNFTALTGVGVDLGISLYLDEAKNMRMALGLGLGYSMEGRMNFSGSLGMAAGFSWHSNFFHLPGVEPFSFWPYIGVGF